MTNPVQFILPVRGGSGGAHSVMQEAQAFWELGIPAQVLVNSANHAALQSNYGDLGHISQNIIGYDSSDHLTGIIRESAPSIVIATTNTSVHALSEVVGSLPGLRTAYYIQDYEPLFYPPDSHLWRIAYNSYGLIPGMIHFAKTRWLQEVVQANHGVNVAKVEASVDHQIYYPDFGHIREKKKHLEIAAMIRPTTPRRAPLRTVRILNQLAASGLPLRISVFGCSPQEVSDYGLILHDAITQWGVLKRRDIGARFRQLDMFLDLSDFQAFGRTAIEAMSCGVIALVPLHGGTSEFAKDGQNAFVIDTRQDDQILEAVHGCIAMSAIERLRMQMNAVITGYNYSVEKAAISELSVLLAP